MPRRPNAWGFTASATLRSPDDATATNDRNGAVRVGEPFHLDVVISAVALSVFLSVFECMFESCQAVAVREAMAKLCAAYDAVDACDLDSLTRAELLSVMDDLETLTCRLPTQTHRLLARLQAETTPQRDGCQIVERGAADPVAAVHW